MLIKVNKDRTIEKQYSGKEGSQNENNISYLEFSLPEEYFDFDKKMVFITKTENFTKNINSENKYIIDDDVSKYKKILCYIWLKKENIDFRSKIFQLNFYNNLEESEEIDEYNS